MLATKKIKKLENKLSAKKSDVVNVEEQSFKAPFIIAKITGVALTSGVNKYTWQGIKQGNTYTWEIDDQVGQSGDNSKAICIQEINIDMTGKTALVPTNSIVLMYRTNNGLFFSASGILGIKYSHITDEFTLVNQSMTEEVWAESTLHEGT